MAGLDLYVGISQPEGKKHGYGAWIAVNGSPENQKEGAPHRFNSVSSAMPKEHLALMAFNEALRKLPRDAKITIHTTDPALCDFVNGDTFSFIKNAIQLEQKDKSSKRENKAGPVETASYGLIGAINRRPKVKANYVSNTPDNEKHLSFLQSAYELARKGEDGAQRKGLKHEKSPARGKADQDAIAESIADGEDLDHEEPEHKGFSLQYG